MKVKIFITVMLFAVFIVVDLVFGLTHGYDCWAEIPAIFALVGLGGCMGIIAAGKLVADKWLKRSEDYYDPS